MIGLHLIQSQQRPGADKHATDRHDQQQQRQQQNNEQVFRANLVRIPSKAGSPLVNLSHYAQQQQDKQQQQKRRQSTRSEPSMPVGHVMEAVAGRSVMIAEPVQRLASVATGDSGQARDNNNVLLLIDEHSGEAPIVIGQRGRSGPPVASSGGRLSKTRQQLELLCAAADFTSIGQQQLPNVNSSGRGAIILAPVVVGRRSHRIQQQQQQARYLFGEFAPELEGVELRQHVLRPIGVVEQIPQQAVASTQAATRFANMTSDGSRRSTSSSSSSSASSWAEQRKQRATKCNRQQQQQQQSANHNVLDNEYTLYEGTRFSAVPEYAIVADHCYNRSSGKQRNGKQGLSKMGNKQPSLESCGPACATDHHANQMNRCDSTNSTYCCSDPNCQFPPQPPPAVNYVDKPKAGRTSAVSKSKKNIMAAARRAAGSSSSSTTHQLVDHHFCQANGHSHPNYLPPLNSGANQAPPVMVMMNAGRQLHHHGKYQSGYSSQPNILAAPSGSSQSSPNGSQTSVSSDQVETTTSAVEQMYESLAAELKAKLGNLQIGPILLPPRDYDTLCRKQGKLDGIELRRSTNPQLVGPIVPEGSAKRLSNDNSSSSGNSSLKSIVGENVP